MENATKALIMAATVLIAVLILALGVYLFRNYSEVARKNEERQSAQSLVQYNTKIEKYKDKTLSIQDVLTIANLAKDYNERKSDKGMEVMLNGSDLLDKLDKKKYDWTDLLDEKNDKEYKISRIDKDDNGIIYSVIITNK